MISRAIDCGSINHLFKLITVVLSLGAVLGIPFSLIPDHTSNGIGTNGCDHGIENITGILMPKVGGLGDDRRRKGTKCIFMVSPLSILPL